MTAPDDEPPVLPDTTRDDTDEGWGSGDEEPYDDVRRLLDERPPHHDRVD